MAYKHKFASFDEQTRMAALFDQIEQPVSRPQPDQQQQQSTQPPRDSVPGRMWSAFDQPWQRNR